MYRWQMAHDLERSGRLYDSQSGGAIFKPDKMRATSDQARLNSLCFSRKIGLHGFRQYRTGEDRQPVDQAAKIGALRTAP